MTCKCGQDTGKHGHADESQCWHSVAVRIAALEQRIYALEHPVDVANTANYRIAERYQVIHDDDGPDTDDGCGKRWQNTQMITIGCFTTTVIPGVYGRAKNRGQCWQCELWQAGSRKGRGMTDIDYTPQERAALIVWALAHGESLTASQAAEMAGITEHGAWILLASLSRVIPIYNDHGHWQVCACRELA